MKINELAQATKLSESAIRYYEKLGLLKCARDKNNIRVFDETDIEWVKFIKRLKETGMPLKNIAEYAVLRYIGDSTLEKRLEMLEEHRNYILAQLDVRKENLIKLDAKIDYYKESIKNKTT